VTARKIDTILPSRPTIEGAGVRLRRAFGPHEVPLLDPFLMLDDFHSENPADYIAGFPWHPHRGIETVTYMINGIIDHGDSLGNKGTIGSGDVQWMTAGSGILHQEMPRPYTGMMQGFQLWVNLPADNKMMEPRYRGIDSKQISSFSPTPGVDVKVIAGKVGDAEGPVQDLVVAAEYLDVEMKPGKEYKHKSHKRHKVFAYVFHGGAKFQNSQKHSSTAGHLVVLADGNEIDVKAGEDGARFLLVSGEPIGEPVAWRGPIVMNTEQELDIAFQEYWSGRFIKSAAKQ